MLRKIIYKWGWAFATGLLLMTGGYRCSKEQSPNPWPSVNTHPVFEWQGINMTAWGKDWWDDSQRVDKALKFILEEGCNLVTLDWAVNFENNGHIVPIEDTASFHPPLETIAGIIARAHEAGLKVMLKPHVTLRHSAFNRNIWNTDIQTFLPSNFFPDYLAYWKQLATFASENHVELLCLGTELNHLDWLFRDDWVLLIQEIRKHYTGPLTYDALFDRWLYNKNIADVVFWDKLDYIGGSLYVPLTTDDNAPVDTLRRAFFYDLGEKYGGEGWFKIDNVISFLQNISAQYQKPLLAVEGGYPSKNQGLYYINGPDPQSYAYDDLQTRGLDAYLGVLSENKGQWFKGVSLWCITPYLLTPESMQTIWHTQDFNFYEKPAAAVVKKHFCPQCP